MGDKRRQQLLLVFLLGVLLFNYPLLHLAGNGDTFVAGVPLLYAWLFAAWGALIALVALIVERRD